MQQSDNLIDVPSDELKWTVQFGLHRRVGEHPTDAETLGIQIIADRLVEHFDRCGLVIKKKVLSADRLSDPVIRQRKNW